MEWGRAKNYLILAFLALNLFLGWRLHSQQDVKVALGWTPEHQDASAARSELAQAGIAVAGDVPVDAPALPLLKVRLREPDADAIVRALFPDQRQVVSPAGGGAGGGEIYQHGSEELSVFKIGLVLYEQKVIRGEGPPDAGTARRIADEFVARLGGLPAGGRFDYVSRDPVSGHYWAYYGQTYNGRPLFGGVMKIEVAGHQVATYQQWWLVPIRTEGERRPTISATEALLRLAGYLHPGRGGRTQVENVELGYYSRLYDPKPWDLTPVWRIRLTDGRIYYLNAYTGMPAD